jgi:hypothetical protein
VGTGALATKAASVPKRRTCGRRVEQAAVSFALSVATLALLAVAAVAGQPSNSDPPVSQPLNGAASAELPQITIEAQRQETERRVHDFVSRVALVSHYESLARWNTPICPMVVGLPRNYGEFVLTRISDVAASAGAPLAPRNCQVNLVVLVTSNPTESLKAWLARVDHRNFTGDHSIQIKRFLDTQRVIRVWYNEQAGGANGSALTPGQPTPGSPCPGLKSSAGAPVNCLADDTRLERTAVWGISSVIEVVDADAIRGLQIGQVADYIAMVGLAEFNLDADVGAAPTILRLFKVPGEAKPSSLSDWDKAYLEALYRVGQTSMLQTGLIIQSMARDLSH